MLPSSSPRRNQCTECMDEFPSSRLAKLNCGHRMCTPCLKKKFKASMTDDHEMPPRCCTTQAIALKHVEKLFDPGFKQEWNYRSREASMQRRIFCPSPRCGQLITGENMFRGEDGRNNAVCGRCHTRVCCSCNNKVHPSRDCPRAKRIPADVRSRQTCYKCKMDVEPVEGHNHIIWCVIFTLHSSFRAITDHARLPTIQPVWSRILHDLWSKMGAMRLPGV